MNFSQDNNQRVVPPPHIVAALEDSSYKVRQEAVEALNKLGWIPDKSKIAALYLIAQNKISECASIGSTAVEPLVTLLSNRDSGIRGSAIQVLGRIGDRQAVKPLLNAFNDPNEKGNRLRIVRALGQIGDAQAVEPLLDALRASDESVREAATTALGQISDPRTKEFIDASILKRLSDAEGYMRAKAVRELREQGDQKVSLILSNLFVRLGDSDRKNRIHAVEALGEIGDPKAVEPLIKRLDDPEWNVRQYAAVALGNFKDDRIAEGLMKLLERESPSNQSVRVAIIKTLGTIGDEKAIDLLIELIKDSDNTIGCEAVEALGNFGTLKVIEALIAALSWETQVAYRSIRALGKIGNERAIEPIVQFARNNIGNAGTFADKDTQESTNQYSKLVAAEALAKLDIETSFDILQQQARLLTSEYSYITTYPDKIKGERGTISKDNNKKLRVLLVKNLEILGDKRVIEILSKFLQDEDMTVQSGAKAALNNLGWKG